MITTKTVKLKNFNNKKPDNLLIEQQLAELGYNPIRWAVINATDSEIILSISVIEN